MTVIAGIAHKGSVYIGGDSAGSNGFEITPRSDAKAFLRPPFAFGVCGSFRVIDLIRYELQVEEPPRGRKVDAREYLVRRLIPALRGCLHEHGALLSARGEEGMLGPFLVGYEGRLFEVDGDFQVGESARGHSSVGCGSSFALASLWDTGIDRRPPKERVMRALENAAEHSPGVREPFVVVQLRRAGLEKRRTKR